MDITLLVSDEMENYSLERAPGPNNIGGGMGVKWARMEQCLSAAYDVKRTSRLDRVETDFVLVEPYWFKWGTGWTAGAPQNIEKRLDAVLERSFRRVMVCSEEHSLCLWPARLRDKLVSNVDWITHNCDYLRNLYRASGIGYSQLLCAAVPEYMFYPVQKRNRVYAASHISWQKQTHQLIELFGLLQDTDIETVYAGGFNLWGGMLNKKESTTNAQLEAELEEVTDIFLGNVPHMQVAYHANAAKHHVHVAYHDVGCQAQQEAALGGATLWGLGHPLNQERPVRQFTDIQELAVALYEDSLEDTSPEPNAEVLAYARKYFSYEAVLVQFQKIIKGG